MAKYWGRLASDTLRASSTSCAVGESLSIRLQVVDEPALLALLDALLANLVENLAHLHHTLWSPFQVSVTQWSLALAVFGCGVVGALHPPA